MYLPTLAMIIGGPQAGIDAADTIYETVQNRRKWAKLGKDAELAAVLWLEANGYTVLATQIYIKTDIGTRITDIIAIDTRTLSEPAFGVEVKANSATRSKLQRAKDLVIEAKGGEVRSWSKAAFPRGTHLRYRTYVWCMDMGTGTLNCPLDQVPSPKPIP